MTKKLLFSLVIIASMITMSFAQAGNQRFLQRQNLRANRFQTFDTANPVEINGSIAKVTRSNRGYGRYRDGLELLIFTGEKNLSVRLGPVAFLDSNNWHFKKGDKIQVTAFKGTGQSKGNFFAAKIQMKGKTLILRDKDGIPAWRFSNLRRRGRR